MEATLIKPVVGEGATVSYVADSYPQTIIEVSKDLKTVIVQEDKGVSAPNARPYSNEWVITRDTNGLIREFTLRKNGRYVQKGDSIKGGLKLTLGIRRKYYAYEF
jgi:hypothetical protein